MAAEQSPDTPQRVVVRKRSYQVSWEPDGTARVLRSTRKGLVEVRGPEAFRAAKAAQGQRIRRPSPHAKRPRRRRR